MSNQHNQRTLCSEKGDTLGTRLYVSSRETVGQMLEALSGATCCVALSEPMPDDFLLGALGYDIRTDELCIVVESNSFQHAVRSGALQRVPVELMHAPHMVSEQS